MLAPEPGRKVAWGPSMSQSLILGEVIALIGYALTLGFIPLILARKKDPTVALGWCLAIVFLPYVGTLIFLTFGNTHIERPLSRKRRHRLAYLAANPRQPQGTQSVHGWRGINAFADALGAFAATEGNRVDHYVEGISAYNAMETAIREARDHIYAEFFIWQTDEIGVRFLDLLADKAREGLRVCVLYDAIGSYWLSNRHLQRFRDAGGTAMPFLPVSLWRRRVQVSLRNHRKILAVDGRVAFTGGLNIGKEYIHRGRWFPYWRDTHLRIEGPAAADLERVFIEDWHFASGELLPEPSDQFSPLPGTHRVQIITSGPDQEHNAIHQIYFTAMVRCTQRLWIMSPYFVPDPSLTMAMWTAARMGVDVRLLCQAKPDKWIPYLAANYYWEDMLESGVRIYRYTRGMMHSKVILVDGQWASVGTANWDIRSLRLNFEVNALFDEPSLVAEFEAQFERDLQDAEEIHLESFRARPAYRRGLENICRLFSAVL